MSVLFKFYPSVSFFSLLSNRFITPVCFTAVGEMWVCQRCVPTTWQLWRKSSLRGSICRRPQWSSPTQSGCGITASLRLPVLVQWVPVNYQLTCFAQLIAHYNHKAQCVLCDMPTQRITELWRGQKMINVKYLQKKSEKCSGLLIPLNKTPEQNN